MIEPKKDSVNVAELITPEVVKKRVLEFFDGIDLKTHIGETRIGVLKIISKPFKLLPWISEVTHKASANGLVVAQFTHQGNDKLSPLEEGKDRDTLMYVLTGFVAGRGELSIRYVEHEKKESELRISTPATANSEGKSGKVGIFENFELNQLVEVLGIKL